VSESQQAVPGREWIGDLLERVPFVEWDRFTTGEWQDGQPCVSVYGWIDREDAYKDFVLLLCWPKPETYYFVTSSAEHSERIYCCLEGVEEADGHNECRRVERAFDVENAVRLAARDGGGSGE